jgi:hypothetical protein
VSEVAELQQVLAAEHAAVYVLGVLGGRAAHLKAPVLQAAIGTAYDLHRGRRDRLTTMVTSAGAQPVPAEPAYALTHHLVTPQQVAAAALHVERSCLTTYGALVAASTGGSRRWAVEALIETATSELGFGGAPEPLPGMRARLPGS